MPRGCRSILVLTLACLAGAPAAKKPPTPPTLSEQATAGTKLSDDSATRLAASVQARVSDASADTSDDRAKLLGYYLGRRVANHDARVKQILWMIANHPADPITASNWCGIDTDDADAIKQATAAWEAAVKAHAAEPVVDGNAAWFFTSVDQSRAVELLKAAIDADPKNPVWLIRQADLDDRRGTDHPSDAAKFGGEALALRESAYALTKVPADRFAVLLKEPNDAMRAGDMIASKRLATQLLETADLFKSDPAYGQAVHVGHIVLGQIAASAGNLEKADDELAAAGKAPASKVIATEGPDLSLAQDLLSRGEKTAVRDYLDSCLHLWPAGGSRLRGWIAEIDDGKTPTLRK
jgi:hypothetical protein